MLTFDKNFMEIRENVALAPYTTFKIGGNAKYFVEVISEQEILEALKWANSQNLPYFILAGGSNILVDDAGYEGLIIKIKNKPLELEKNIIKEENGIIHLRISCFVGLADLVAKTIQASLSGLEWAMGIPGTVGGAVFGNSGAYGNEMSDNVVSVKSLKPKSFEIFERIKEECDFEYRGSCFKKNKEVILSAVIELKRGDKEQSMQKIKEIIVARGSRAPKLPSAGSIFKNLILDKQSEGFLKIVPQNLVKGGKISAGYFIEQCGLKGEKIGDAMISNEHANVIVNCGNAKFDDVENLIKMIKDKVREKYGIELKEEIRYLN